MKDLIAAVDVDPLIHTIRGRRVMLDRNLAAIYGVTTWHLNEAVKRNHRRFPEDFVFQITRAELESLTSQIAMSKSGRGGRRTMPYAFTEHGAVMLASVLRSPVAIEASINVVRAFNRLRQIADKHKDLASALEKLEREFQGHASRTEARLADHAENIKALFSAIHEIMEPPVRSRKRIGFKPG